MPVIDPRLAGKLVPKISREAMKRGHVARTAKARGVVVRVEQIRPPSENSAA
jgi:hypothetical protein